MLRFAQHDARARGAQHDARGTGAAPGGRIGYSGSRLASAAAGIALLLPLALAAFVLPACRQHHADAPAPRADAAATHEPAHVVALGNLRAAPRASDAQIELARFLFGVEPEPAIGLVTPAALAADGDALLVCDLALRAVMRWEASAAGLAEPTLDPRPGRPVAAKMTLAGERLVVDAGARAVLLYGAAGTPSRRFALSDVPFRPADAVALESEVWVTNPARDGIEVFDLRSGAPLRSIGGRGDRPGEFHLPLGMALGPDGCVYIADMLNARVQVLDASGRPLRTLGGPGDRPGAFGRPKAVAVAPDGIVFVSDAALQRVQAFDATGRALTAFGQEGPPAERLLLPGGLTILSRAPPGVRRPPPDIEPSYFVLVSEQLNNPGVRVFAWRTPAPNVRRPVPAHAALARRPPPARVNAAGTRNPHWSASDCGVCHSMQSGAPAAIRSAAADALCLSCHDGRLAVAESHPVGRLPHGAGLTVPSDWPLSDGAIGCLTCHDVVRHCTDAALRPAANPAMLRGVGPHETMTFCANCHIGGENWRMNPHEPVANREQQLLSCAICHSETPAIPANGRRQFDAKLHDARSDGCLRCHAPHWDYAPGGHLGKYAPVAGLPLYEQRMTCYTCHNPHPPGIFPAGSELDRRAAGGADKRLALRAAQIDLCFHCHPK